MKTSVTADGRPRRKPFAPIRRGLVEHVLSGRLRGAGFAVYIWLHLQVNHATGTVRTNARRLSDELGFHPVTVRRELAALKRKGYLRYEATETNRQLYEIAIEKYHDHFEAPWGCREGGRLHGGLHGRLQERGATERKGTPIQPSKKIEERRTASTLRVREADADSKLETRLTKQQALQAAPRILRETLELFFLKTSRDGLVADELEVLGDLERAHTPAVIQKAITAAVERFTQRGQAPREITLHYVWESLKRFTTRRPPAASTPAVRAGKYPPGLTRMRLTENHTEDANG